MNTRSTFNQLIELVNLLSSKKLPISNIANGKNTEDSLLIQLYKGIADGIFKNDEDAAKALYHAPSTDVRYDKLKHRLRKRLIKQLFFIDINTDEYSDFQIAHYNCYHNTAAIAILSTYAATITAIALVERTIHTAIKYELTPIILLLADILEGYYSSRNKEKYLHYTNIIEKYAQIQRVERLATKYKRHLFHLHIGKKSHDNTHLSQAISYANEMEELLRTFNSHIFSQNAYNIIAIRHEIVNDYEKVIEVCNKAISAFKTKKSTRAYNIATFTFSYKKIICYTTLKDHEQAKISAKECLNHVKPGGINWYNTLAESITSSLYTKDYKSAYAFLEQALNHPKYTIQNYSTKELWMTYKAYIAYFIQHYQLAIAIEYDFDVKSNPYPFLQKIPLADKNKWEHNIHILFTHILFFLKAKEYDIVTHVVVELKKHFHKNLRNDATFRANCLTKMLEVMVKEAKFNKTATIRKAERFEKRLLAHPIEKSKQASNVEIVPYEHIWECVVDNLEKDYWHI